MRRLPRGFGAAVLLAIAVACSPALQTASGLLTGIDSPAIGQVDSFELRTEDGRTLVFDTTALDFRPEFPVAHLADHQRSASPVTVTYRQEGDRLVVTRLDD
ncbi:hypothetical protein BH24CHL9_BH24CHL9_03250 [soil metagenome]